MLRAIFQALSKNVSKQNPSSLLLAGVIPAGFVGLTKLHSLHLYINRLTGEDPSGASMQGCYVCAMFEILPSVKFYCCLGS